MLCFLGDLWHHEAPKWVCSQKEKPGEAEVGGVGEATRRAETPGERGGGAAQGGGEVWLFTRLIK